jgi:hypothetical protein|tara:strand:- start:6509 stop:6742 length:234 start_codon:yes stop_codon:yes gene_type:complete
MKNNLETYRNFGMAVENMVLNSDITYMEAIMEFMKKENIEEDVLYKMIKKNPVLKIKLELESQEYNLLQKDANTALQ